MAGPPWRVNHGEPFGHEVTSCMSDRAILIVPVSIYSQISAARRSRTPIVVIASICSLPMEHFSAVSAELFSDWSTDGPSLRIEIGGDKQGALL